MGVDFEPDNSKSLDHDPDTGQDSKTEEPGDTIEHGHSISEVSKPASELELSDLIKLFPKSEKQVNLILGFQILKLTCDPGSVESWSFFDNFQGIVQVDAEMQQCRISPY